MSATIEVRAPLDEAEGSRSQVLRWLKRVGVASGADGDAVAIRPRCYLTLTIDHRAMDGNRANRFLGTLVDRLEHWRD
ncbi:MAG TPA: 2-oxo acid dehydrogenase subunit E2 [Steroidobacteraceae bacterium]|nr:2-oxo acid dehydrogenase subunit E2 [Steroidobacteraceae bacterium]